MRKVTVSDAVDNQRVLVTRQQDNPLANHPIPFVKKQHVDDTCVTLPHILADENVTSDCLRSITTDVPPIPTCTQ